MGRKKCSEFSKKSTEQNMKTKPKTNPINKLNKWMIIVIIYCKLCELLKIKTFVYLFLLIFLWNSFFILLQWCNLSKQMLNRKLIKQLFREDNLISRSYPFVWEMHQSVIEFRCFKGKGSKLSTHIMEYKAR